MKSKKRFLISLRTGYSNLEYFYTKIKKHRMFGKQTERKTAKNLPDTFNSLSLLFPQFN